MNIIGIHEGNVSTGSWKPHKITEEIITAGNKTNKIKTERRTKREDVRIWTTPDMLHN